jgi:hypothetical protein
MRTFIVALDNRAMSTPAIRGESHFMLPLESDAIFCAN